MDQLFHFKFLKKKILKEKIQKEKSGKKNEKYNAICCLCCLGDKFN